MPDRHYTDPRLVAVYDVENSGREDIDFYLDLAGTLRATTVVDLGCGTGVLATDLAARGHHVTGVDPAQAMLAVARARPGGDRVTWVEGTLADLPSGSAELVVMTGHVAQVFVDDASWRQVLDQARRVLVPGGRLAFESRNPAAAAWTSWTRAATLTELMLPDGERVDTWVEVTGVLDGVVTFEGHNAFVDGDLVSASTLRFRTAAELTASLSDAGFTVQDVLGSWDGRPADEGSRELIVLAARGRAVRRWSTGQECDARM